MFAVAGCLIVVLTGYLVFRLKTIEVENQTYDFTGMSVYPMVKVEGGTFVMGTDKTEDEDCMPHRVTLNDFYIGQFEVSQGLWETVMGNNPSAFRSDENRDSLPVENVSFEDVQLFISRLNAKTGKNFSLPTEAQWEYAARGGVKSRNTDYAGSEKPYVIWYRKDSPMNIKYDFSVNELGIYHMSGNVAEWCADYYSEDFYASSENSVDPRNDRKDEYHVFRGGSFKDNDEGDITVYYRNADSLARSYVGFRLVINEI